MHSPFHQQRRNLSPARQLILQTVRQNWPLLILGQFANLLATVMESLTLGVIFLAITLMTQMQGTSGVGSLPSLQRVPGLEQWLANTPRTQAFLLLLVAAIVLQTLLSACSYSSRVSAEVLGARLRHRITERLYSQILSFSYGHVSSYKVGDLLEHIATGQTAVRDQIIGLNNLVSSSCMTLAYAVVLVSLSPQLSLVAIAMFLAVLTIQQQLLPRIRAQAAAIESNQVGIQSLITESIQAMRLLHSFGKLDWFQQRLSRELQQEEHLRTRLSLILNATTPIVEILPTLCIAIIAGLGFLLFRDRASGVLPSLATFILALQRLAMRTRAVVNDRGYLAENSGRVRRLEEILNPTGKEFAPSGSQPFVPPLTQLRFRDLSLTYPGRQQAALQSFSLDLPARTSLALVGSSGAGKSTLVDLLLRLYEPDQGQIEVNGRPLSTLDTSSWRAAIGVVSQDSILLNASLAENIAFGQAGATPEAIREAAAQAQALKFIEALPQGLDTVVGERGHRLSGGQRQRIALARALLRRPQLLILDEATSALDSESEQLIQQALDQLQGENLAADRGPSTVHSPRRRSDCGPGTGPSGGDRLPRRPAGSQRTLRPALGSTVLPPPAPHPFRLRLLPCLMLL